MKCEQFRSLMMDFLYDEMSEEDRISFNSHLSQCEECRKEVESLRFTSRILRQWEDVDHDINVIPVKDKPLWITRFKDSILNLFSRPRKIATGLAYGFAAIFLLLAIANAEISFKDGDFKLSMGLLPRPEQQENINDLYAQRLVEQILNENIRLTSSLIQESETRQRKELAYILLSLQKDIERQRYQDLNLVGHGLDTIQKNTNQQIQQIDYTLNEIIHPENKRY
jgi:hypothetical protein